MLQERGGKEPVSPFVYACISIFDSIWNLVRVFSHSWVLVFLEDIPKFFFWGLQLLRNPFPFPRQFLPLLCSYSTFIVIVWRNYNLITLWLLYNRIRISSGIATRFPPPPLSLLVYLNLLAVWKLKSSRF